jgi:prepilin-type N-terminal cleavage/methylation domain-containing protein
MARTHGRHAALIAGFTFIELLVVLGVLAMLAALILSGLAAARESARRTSCMSNLRQIGHAMRMYVDDFGDRPPRFQALWDAGLLRSRAVLICPDDQTGNWGGVLYDQERKQEEPWIPPETVRHSYMYPVVSAKVLDSLAARDGGSVGIMVCQLHGSRLESVGFPPGILDYEGTVLRLQADGAVVERQILWERSRTPSGYSIRADATRLISDRPAPAP